MDVKNVLENKADHITLIFGCGIKIKVDTKQNWREFCDDKAHLFSELFLMFMKSRIFNWNEKLYL